MRNIPSLLNPSEYITYQLEREKEREISIAFEVHLARQCSRLRYRDLMDSAPAGLASKDSLIRWLDDYKKKNGGVRPGVITWYKHDHRDHFENGVWRSMFFAAFVKYAADKLTDKDFVHDRKIASLYKISFLNPVWFQCASSVMGLKLIEDLYKHNALNSDFARATIEFNLRKREELDKMISGFSAAAKQQNIDFYYLNQLKAEIEASFRRDYEKTIQKYENHQDIYFYAKYKRDIEKSLAEIPAHIKLTMIEGEVMSQ